MTAAPVAKRQLVEPDYWTSPSGARQRPTLTYGPAVAEVCADAGYAPDPQQELGLDLVFAIRPDGSPLSFSFCVICARQNLKSGLFLQCCIGWLFVTEVQEIAWSAHELRTSLNAQEELFRVLESPALSRYLPATKTSGKFDANGKERQELNTGQTVWFQTRTRDGGRGLGKPKVILDEAFKLKKRTAGALLPILLAQHHPQLLRGSSAPPIDTDADDLRDVIDRGRGHKSPEMAYLEWLAEREPCADLDCHHPKDALARGIDCALDREHLLRQANPTLTTGRITIRTLRNLRQELAPEEYMRECLGWMDTETAAGPPVFDVAAWRKLGDKDIEAPARCTVVLDVEPDGSAGSIGLVGSAPEGRALLVTRTEPGIGWMVPTLTTVRDSLGEDAVLEVALHPSNPAGALVPALTAAGFEVTKLVHSDLARGCTTIQLAVLEDRIRHQAQADLTKAVSVARTRMTTTGEVWDRGEGRLPISPVVSLATALYRWDLLNAEHDDTPPPAPESLDESSVTYETHRATHAAQMSW